MTCIDTSDDPRNNPMFGKTPKEMAAIVTEARKLRRLETDWRRHLPQPPLPRDISCCLPPPKIKHRDPQDAKRAAFCLLARTNMRLVREFARTNSARLRQKRKRRNSAGDDKLLRKEIAAVNAHFSSLAKVAGS